MPELHGKLSRILPKFSRFLSLSPLTLCYVNRVMVMGMQGELRIHSSLPKLSKLDQIFYMSLLVASSVLL